MTLVGQREKLRGAATASQLTANLALGNLAYATSGDQRVEVAADRRGRQAKTGTQGTCALGAAIVQGPSDPVAGTGVVRASGRTRSAQFGRRRVGDHRGFHNTNVTYLLLSCTHPLLGRSGHISRWARRVPI